ncbi:hypothetical protein GCM10009547_19780 [Sporichthya brevicatena]|uniref:Uncharacterized protein n=1 Tax=Sporichthya brevicatena TaxID=171442 RepID=A0ABN1GRR9_9ACTN
MSERQLNRLGAWGGLGYIALMMTAWIVFWQTNVFTTFGETPDSDAPADQIVAFYSEHRTTQLMAGCVWAAALAPLGLFLSRLYTALKSAEEGHGTGATAYLFGAFAFLAAPILWVTGVFGVSFRVGELHPSVTQYNHDLFLLPIVTCAPLWVLMFGGIALVILVTGRGVFPRWLGILALVAAPCQFLYFGALFDPSGIWWSSNQGILVAGVAYGSQLGWIVAACVVWLRSSSAVARTPDLVPSGV